MTGRLDPKAALHLYQQPALSVNIYVHSIPEPVSWSSPRHLGQEVVIEEEPGLQQELVKKGQ